MIDVDRFADIPRGTTLLRLAIRTNDVGSIEFFAKTRLGLGIGYASNTATRIRNSRFYIGFRPWAAFFNFDGCALDRRHCSQPRALPIGLRRHTARLLDHMGQLMC